MSADKTISVSRAKVLAKAHHAHGVAEGMLIFLEAIAEGERNGKSVAEISKQLQALFDEAKLARNHMCATL